MGSLEIDRRIGLLKELLYRMKETEGQLQTLADDIGKASRMYYQLSCSDSQQEIRMEMEKYKGNIGRINTINSDITAKVNQWYEFIKNKREISRLMFPVRYYLKKRRLNSYIKRMNGDISAITIDNRFIKEKLTLLEHQLEINAIKKIKEDEKYLEYEKLTQKKELVAAELMYLIPTIPGICPANIDAAGIEELLEKLSRLEVA